MSAWRRSGGAACLLVVIGVTTGCPIVCSDLRCAGAGTGVYSYNVVPPGSNGSGPPVQLFCDMDTDGGGWTVFQRRDNTKPPGDFENRVWDDYKYGFGDLTGEFWMGLDRLHNITSVKDRKYELRIDLQTGIQIGLPPPNKTYAVYQNFQISSEEDGYRLSASNYRGNAGDSLKYHVNRRFWTRDRDQRSCALHFGGGWWYRSNGTCAHNNLNGRHPKKDSGRNPSGPGLIFWIEWTGFFALNKTEMKIRTMA